MTKQNFKKILATSVFVFIFSLGFYSTASAAILEYIDLSVWLNSFNLPTIIGDINGPHGCPIRAGDSVETCDIEPGGYMTVDGTLQWGLGFSPPLPAMGMGLPPGSGYIPTGYPLDCAAASTYPGSGPGNSFSGGFYNGAICEISFNSSVSGTGSAQYHIYAAPDAPRGQRYLMGLASNGGTNTLQTDFYVRIKPLACQINSFTCSANTLSWSTSNCTSRFIDGGIGSVSATGSTAGSSGTIYGMTASNADSSTLAVAVCPTIATLTASWNATGNTYTTLPVTSGQTYSIPFTFRKSGSGSLKFSDCKGSSANIPLNQISVTCPTPVGAEISY